jgi:hypothetical protein
MGLNKMSDGARVKRIFYGGIIISLDEKTLPLRPLPSIENTEFSRWEAMKRFSHSRKLTLKLFASTAIPSYLDFTLLTIAFRNQLYKIQIK